MGLRLSKIEQIIESYIEVAAQVALDLHGLSLQRSDDTMMTPDVYQGDKC